MLAEESVEAEQTSALARENFTAGSLHGEQRLSASGWPRKQHCLVLRHSIQRPVLLFNKSDELRLPRPSSVAGNHCDLEARAQDEGDPIGRLSVGPYSAI